MNAPAGSSAFPFQFEVAPGSNNPFTGKTQSNHDMARYLFTGMSLRDYFAAAAIPAVIAAYVEANGRCLGTDHLRSNGASIAYAVADAMLAEREK